jgi:chemotaxis protein CheC
MLLGNPDGTTTALDEMERSVLGEIGNVMGSHFLNTLSDYTGLDLRVSPPEVMMDMAGAILDPALAELMAVADEATVVESSFSAQGREINGKFLVMPNPNLQRVLMVRLGAND